MGQIPFYPYATTNAADSFSVQSSGLIAGTAYNDPSSRFALAQGILASSEVLPMFGGIPIVEGVGGASGGGNVARAATVGGITGFSVFDQAYSWVASPQSPVPSAGAGMTVPFYRLGSGARVAVPMDPSLVDLNGMPITSQVSWDFNNGVLQPYDAATATYAITSATGTYNNNGTWTVAIVAAAATPVGAVGDQINISGVTGTGATLINGNQTVSAFTDNEHFSILVTAAAGAIGALTTSAAVLNYGTGALPVKVLQTSIGNSKVPTYNASTGAVTWNGSGSAAIILL